MQGGPGANPANTNFMAAGGSQLADAQGFNYRTTDLKNPMQRGQSHTVGGAAGMTTVGALVGQSNGFHQVGQTVSSQNN